MNKKLFLESVEIGKSYVSYVHEDTDTTIYLTVDSVDADMEFVYVTMGASSPEGDIDFVYDDDIGKFVHVINPYETRTLELITRKNYLPFGLFEDILNKPENNQDILQKIEIGKSYYLARQLISQHTVYCMVKGVVDSLVFVELNFKTMLDNGDMADMAYSEELNGYIYRHSDGKSKSFVESPKHMAFGLCEFGHIMNYPENKCDLE